MNANEERISRYELEDILVERTKTRVNNLSLADLPEPELIPGLLEAAHFIIEKLKNGEIMLLCGDYDCDGICASTIYIEFFNLLKDYLNLKDYQINYIIPDRFKDGYGVSKNIIDHAISIGAHFIVTVDNGIGAYNAVEYSNENNIDVVITDHHLPPTKTPVPNAKIIVDLKYNQGDFRFQEISGATISWYLCCMIRKILNLPIDMRKWIDLVAITIISDVMPLADINLPLYRAGLELIKNSNREIYKYIFTEYELKTLDETNIGFKLVPMINAVGRLDNATKAVKYLLSKERTEIIKGVEYFLDINNKRKLLTQESLDLVMNEAKEQYKMNFKSIIIKKDGLHEGIVGIIAGKIAETFNRPTYVFSWNRANKCWKGSGRTSGSIHLYQLTENGAENAIGFGGHAGAVGVAVSEDKFKLWKHNIIEAASFLDPSKFVLDTEKPFHIDLSDINKDFIDMLNSFKPFGMGFPMPLFKTKAWINVLDSYKNGLHWKTSINLKTGVNFTTYFFHDKTILSFHKKEMLLNFTPVQVYSNKGYEIELHAHIPFEYREN